MGKTQVEAFVEKVKEDASLQDKVAALPVEDMAAAVDQGAAIAKSAGFDISKEEIQGLLVEYCGDRELSDEELTQVAGGGNAGPKSAPSVPAS